MKTVPGFDFMSSPLPSACLLGPLSTELMSSSITLVTTTPAFGNPFHIEPLNTFTWSFLTREWPFSTPLTARTMFLLGPASLQRSTQGPALPPCTLAAMSPSHTPQQGQLRLWPSSVKGRRTVLRVCVPDSQAAVMEAVVAGPAAATQHPGGGE